MDVTILVPYEEGLEADCCPDVLSGHLTDAQLARIADWLGAVGREGYARSHVEGDLIWFENDTGEGPYRTYEECQDSGTGTLGKLTYRVVLTTLNADPKLAALL